MNAMYGLLGGAIAGALGGAIGWGLTALIWADRDPADRPKWVSAVCFALLIALSRPIIHSLTTPSVDDELHKAEQQLPALAALRATDASGYAEVRSAEEDAQNGTITEAEGMQRVHAALMRAYQRKLPSVPDSLVQVQTQVASAEYSALEGTPDICVSYIEGTEAVDLRQYLPPNLIAADQDMISRVLRAPAADHVTIASEADVQRAAAPIIVRIAHDEQTSVSQVAEALQMKGDQELICRVYAALLLHISELPTQQAAAMSRGLARMGQNSS